MAKRGSDKNLGGRPIEIDRAKLVADLAKYIDETDIPIIAEFAYRHGLNRSSIYEITEVSDALKKLIAKKEAALERLMLSGKPNVAAGAIFSLKQLGWSDRTEVKHSGELTTITDSAKRRQRIEELKAKLNNADNN